MRMRVLRENLRVEIENEMRVFLESLNFEIEMRVSQKSAVHKSARINTLTKFKVLTFFRPIARLLRDSHLDLKIETLKENSYLILDLDSQFFSENSHSQLSKFF